MVVLYLEIHFLQIQRKTTIFVIINFTTTSNKIIFYQVCHWLLRNITLCLNHVGRTHSSGTIMHGFGDLKYPILVYDGYTTEYMNRNIVEDTFHFIPLRKIFNSDSSFGHCYESTDLYDVFSRFSIYKRTYI